MIRSELKKKGTIRDWVGFERMLGGGGKWKVKKDGRTTESLFCLFHIGPRCV